MRGNNVLLLNHASMLEALQLYVQKEFEEAAVPFVTDVKFDENGGLFRVVLQSPEDPAQLRLPLSQARGTETSLFQA